VTNNPESALAVGWEKGGVLGHEGLELLLGGCTGTGALSKLPQRGLATDLDVEMLLHNGGERERRDSNP
jgi:hypothetical protein